MQTTNKKRPGKKEPTVDELLAAIAKATLRIDTLETRKSDSLDFHDVAVWSVKWPVPSPSQVPTHWLL